MSTTLQKTAAWSVHAYTAFGAVCGFGALVATTAGNYRQAFGWLVCATVIDATDGVLARAAQVKEHAPTFDGARLDDIVDYLTYVVAPVFLLHQAGLLPAGWGGAVAALVLLSSGYGFASADAKSDDYFFTGFPSYWNIVALYLVAAGLSPLVNAVILLVLCVLVFVRIGYVYPSRTPVLRGTTTVLGAVWAIAVIAIVWTLPAVPPLLVMVSLYFPIYYAVLSFVLHRRRGRR